MERKSNVERRADRRLISPQHLRRLLSVAFMRPIRFIRARPPWRLQIEGRWEEVTALAAPYACQGKTFFPPSEEKCFKCVFLRPTIGLFTYLHVSMRLELSHDAFRFNFCGLSDVLDATLH